MDVGPIAASCFDEGWIAWAEERLGPASARSLGADARVLASVLREHDTLAHAQALAWVFRDPEKVHASRDRELAELDAADVDDASALASARRAGPAVEVLRAAAELELDALGAMPAGDDASLAIALHSLTRCAPRLADATVETVRPLPRRGRAFDRTIFVGFPGVAGASSWHASWQAAHEATVLEVQPQHPGFVDQERAALALLRSRARAAGLEDAHARWLETLDLTALGPIPDVADGA